MKIVVGNKLKEISKEDFENIKNKYKKVEIDLGTGNGRYVFKNALENPETLYIGIDPAEKQLRKYSKKAVRKNLENALFVLASAEMLPEELNLCANKVNIFLPWGSLLDYVANFDQEIIQNIKKLMAKRGNLRIIFGYNEQQEPTETERLNLEKLNKTYLNEELIPKYEETGFVLKNCKKLERKELQNYETSWSKRLSFGKPRALFLLELNKAD